MTQAQATQERTISAGTYDVRIGSGLLGDIGAIAKATAPAHRYAIITDSNVGPLHSSDVSRSLGESATSVHAIPAGEASKSRESWTRLTDEMLAAGCGRDTTVIALGGGVVGDLAGFVAATFMRGVPVIQCPTSLLAMIDASVGGKTGVDTAAGKNLVGAFHPPAAVVADVDAITSLPLEHRRAGLAEAVKHGVVADASHFSAIEAALPALLDANASALLDIVSASVAIKAGVAAEDPFERGRRRTLNFGHTIGHAIEHLSRYRMAHGECVAVGMVLEARIAERLAIAERGTADRIAQLLGAAGLPVSRPAGMSAESILAATRGDKKARAGAVEYALPRRIGAMEAASGRWSLPVDDALVLEVLA